MTESALEKLFEHNHWANLKIIDVCLTLSDAELDAEPQSAAYGSIRSTLIHLVRAQQGYLRLLTLPYEQQQTAHPTVTFGEVRESARASGEGFVALVQDATRLASLTRVQTYDGYWVEPWVVLVQVINHATEHREQIKMLLTALGKTPPAMDGWTHGEATGALVPITP